MTAPIPTRDIAPSLPQQPTSRWQAFSRAALPVAIVFFTVWLPRTVVFAWKYLILPTAWAAWWVFRLAWNIVFSMFRVPIRL